LPVGNKEKEMLMRWATALMLFLGTVPADAVEDFYKAKTITVIVAYGPGGGNDVYARVLAHHMSKYIPGKPNIVVNNMPGAGSLKATNYIYNVAPKDGTVFGIVDRNVALMALLKTDQNVQYDPNKFTWIGSSSSGENDAYVLITRKDAKNKSIDDLRNPKNPPLILGITGQGTSSDAWPTVLRDMLGFNTKNIIGYTDTGALYLAMERSEIEGRTTGYSSVRSNKPEWLKPDGPMQILVVMGRKTRYPELPNVPTARELTKTAEDRAVIEVLELPYAMSRPFAAPPGVPTDRAAALQKAFMDTHKDPEYLKEAERLKIDVSPIDGDEVLRLIQGISKVTPEQIKKVEALVRAN
jgi:tripartite-type tricarboxylate transporter receptor subunit TctC